MGQAKSRLTCGDFGGRNVQGEPCGVSAVDGPCRRHVGQVEEAVSDILNPGFEFLTPPFKRTKNKVCIVGFTSHRDIALTLDRDEWEIWGLNELYRYMPVAAFDRWFEIHGREYLENDDDGKKHIEDLKSLSIPIYMQKVHEDIPASVKFPRDELCETLDSKYWTNCPAWMLGYAIAMGFEEIAMVGVDMAQDTEYQVQRPCCEHWLGYARGKGIKAWVPDMSDLMKSVGLYGYEDEGSLLYRKLDDRLKWLHVQDNERLALIRRLEAEYQTKSADLKRMINRFEGAEEEVGTQAKSAKRDKRLEEITEKLKAFRGQQNAMEAEYTSKHTPLIAERNQIVGGIQNTNYILRSWMVKADGLDGGLVPDRSLDPMTGIKAPAGDNQEPAPALVGA